MFKNVVDLINFIESQKRMNPKVSLDRFRKICEIYGNPQNGLKYIHVGGTNGKGSTVSFIKNTLRDAGFNVASYVSPYVIEFSERISYNDKFIDDKSLLEIGNYIVENYYKFEELDMDKPSFFEFVTLMAFIYFSRLENLDYVVLEVGLGGILDATNIITPLVSVITNVNYDHMNVLGNTLSEIAYNKLGIVKEGIPLVTIYNEEIIDQIKMHTSKLNSDLIVVNKDDINDLDLDFKHTSFSYKEFKDVSLKLLGRHQAENAAIAIEVFKILKNKYNIKLDIENLYQGLEKTIWPGRLQVVHTDPTVLLDGAHNIDGIRRLTEFIKDVKADKFIKIIFAVSSNKQKEEMIEMLESVADEIIFSSFHYKRSDTAVNLIELSHHKNKRVEDDLEKLVQEAKNDKEKLIIFCGSLYFVSELIALFNPKNN